jgi:hypothetical protein
VIAAQKAHPLIRARSFVMHRHLPTQARPAAAAMQRRVGIACAEAIVALALFASLCTLVLLIGRGVLA